MTSVDLDADSPPPTIAWEEPADGDGRFSKNDDGAAGLAWSGAAVVRGVASGELPPAVWSNVRRNWHTYWCVVARPDVLCPVHHLPPMIEDSGPCSVVVDRRGTGPSVAHNLAVTAFAVLDGRGVVILAKPPCTLCGRPGHRRERGKWICSICIETRSLHPLGPPGTPDYYM
jgi:hypothetical protein